MIFSQTEQILPKNNVLIFYIHYSHIKIKSEIVLIVLTLRYLVVFTLLNHLIFLGQICFAVNTKVHTCTSFLSRIFIKSIDLSLVSEKYIFSSVISQFLLQTTFKFPPRLTYHFTSQCT